MNSLRMAVIGGGHLGGIHASLLSRMDDVQLLAVADPDEHARQRLAEKLSVQTVADYRPLIEQMDAAVLAVPTSLHREIGTELLRRGVHLLVEKPLAGSDIIGQRN